MIPGADLGVDAEALLHDTLAPRDRLGLRWLQPPLAR
jgi:hypothetical protein